MQGAWTGVFRGTGVRLYRILDMNFREFLFHALRCISSGSDQGSPHQKDQKILFRFIVDSSLFARSEKDTGKATTVVEEVMSLGRSRGGSGLTCLWSHSYSPTSSDHGLT
jgi:hypothetical protein